MVFTRRPYKNRRPLARKRLRRRKRTAAPRRSALSFRNPFPEKQTSTLTYCTQGQLDPTTDGFGALATFRANSIYDPELSGVGHQPSYHDILAAVYERYSVVSSSLSVQFWSPTSSSSGQCMVYACIRPNSGDVPTTGNTYATLMEQGGIRFKPLGARDGGNDITRARVTYSPRRLYKKSPYDEDDLQALYGANPNTSPTFAIGVVPILSSDDIGAVRYVVTMKFKVLSMRKKHDLVED